MGSNIHALRIEFRQDEVRVRALAENRRGVRYTRKSIRVKASRKDKTAYLAATEQAINEILAA